MCATKKILPVKIPGVLSAKMSQALPAQAAPPAKMSKTFPPEVLKLDKKLPVQVSEAPIKPTKASSSTVSLAPPAITKNPFPAPAVYLAASVLVKYLKCSSLLIRVLNKTTSATAPPWLPQSWSPAVAASCSRASSGTSSRSMPSSMRSWSAPETWARDCSRESTPGPLCCFLGTFPGVQGRAAQLATESSCRLVFI